MTSAKLGSSSRKSTRTTGAAYEAHAARYLVDRGFSVLEKNWRTGRKEIDLIVRKGNLIAFVEVKAVRSDRYGHPSGRVDRRKRENLIAAAEQYIIDKDLVGFDFRFDVITFYKSHLEHFPDAFQGE